MRNNFFKALALGSALSVSAGYSSDAMAGDKTAADIKEIVMTDTGISSLDDLFNQIKTVNDTITGAATDIADAKASIQTALGAAGDVTVEKAIADFKANAKGMIKLDMSSGSPKLSLSPEAPEDIKKTIGAVNDAVKSIKGATEKLKSVPDEVKAIGEKAKGLMDPKALKADAKDAGVKLGATLKAAKGNLGALKDVPHNLECVAGEAKSTLDLVKELGG